MHWDPPLPPLQRKVPSLKVQELTGTATVAVEPHTLKMKIMVADPQQAAAPPLPAHRLHLLGCVSFCRVPPLPQVACKAMTAQPSCASHEHESATSRTHSCKHVSRMTHALV